MADWTGVEGTSGVHAPWLNALYAANCLYCSYDCSPDHLCDCCHVASGHRKVWVDENGKEVTG